MTAASLALSVLLAASPAPPRVEPDPRPPEPTPESAERLARRALALVLASEPDVRRVQDAAAARFDRSAPDPRDVQGEARWAALLPRVTAEYRHDEQSNRTVGLQGSGEVDYLRLAPGNTYLVRATWDLGDLVAPPGELAAATAAQVRARRRAEVVAHATAVYHERLKLRVTLLLAPPADPLARAKLELDVARLAAELESLTGWRPPEEDGR